jgi:hypothetical protein
MLWCIHVDANNGNLIYNDILVAANGVYVGNAAWPAQLATLQCQPLYRLNQSHELVVRTRGNGLVSGWDWFVTARKAVPSAHRVTKYQPHSAKAPTGNSPPMIPPRMSETFLGSCFSSTWLI